MKTIKTVSEMVSLSAEIKKAGKTIGLVPTMGALHDGHFSLIKKARKQTDFVIVSIFVNPTQFGAGEDFEKYPRTLKTDIQNCSNLGTDAVFAPTAEQMYGQNGNLTWVVVEKLTENLCGKSRPEHFKGVTTVCSKLFNITKADTAFFGQKDAQQAIIIKKMVADLNMPLKIVVCPIVRELDGLAMSSRNKYLTAEQRKSAPLLYASLQQAKILIDAGLKNSNQITEQIAKTIKISPLAEIDYISIVDIETLQPVEKIKEGTLIALAVRFAQTRLIDNIIIN